jgi:hypothetical protein
LCIALFGIDIYGLFKICVMDVHLVSVTEYLMPRVIVYDVWKVCVMSSSCILGIRDPGVPVNWIHVDFIIWIRDCNPSYCGTGDSILSLDTVMCIETLC